MKNKKKILITGMPYSGKSYLSTFLRKIGINAIDADSINGLGQWFDKGKNKVVFPPNADKEWLNTHDFLWDKDFLNTWLSDQTSTVYLFGLSANVLELAEFFDEMYYLDLHPTVLKKRFITNQRKNIMGQTEEQQSAILTDLEDFTQKAREKKFIFIDADLPPEEIYRKIVVIE